MGLKASSQKIGERNQWLAQQNQDLTQKIKNMQAYLKALDRKKEQAQGRVRNNLSQQNDSSADDASLSDQQNLESKLQEAVGEQSALQDDVMLKQKQVVFLQKKVDDLKARVNKKNNELKNVIAIPLRQEFEENKKQLTQMINRTQKKVDESSRQLNQINKLNAKPFQNLSMLDQKQANLKQALNLLEEERKSAEEENKAITSDISDLQTQKKTQREELDQAILDLKAKQKDLSDILAQAQTRLQNIPMEAHEIEKEGNELKQNMATIEQVNVSLKGEYSNLEKTLSDLKR